MPLPNRSGHRLGMVFAMAEERGGWEGVGKVVAPQKAYLVSKFIPDLPNGNRPGQPEWLRHFRTAGNASDGRGIYAPLVRYSDLGWSNVRPQGHYGQRDDIASPGVAWGSSHRLPWTISCT